MPFMILSPREKDLIMRPVTGTGENADLLRKIQALVDPKWGELTISGADAIRVRSAHRNYRLGYERQFGALITAMERTR